jgi:hypothetical protein
MPSRRSALFILGSLATGSLGLLSTGAFSTVEATRTATVDTAGDNAALLEITPLEGESEQFVNDADGTVNIDIPNVNKNAITDIDQLLEVTNNGTERVTVGFVAEYADQKGDFSEQNGEVLPYGYTYAANDADPADVALVMWASPKKENMDDAYAEVRPELVTTGFDDSSDGLVDGSSSRGEILDTIDGGTKEDGTGRKIDPAQSVNIGLVIDTRDETIDPDENGGIPKALDKHINLVAELTENVEKAS